MCSSGSFSWPVKMNRAVLFVALALGMHAPSALHEAYAQVNKEGGHTTASVSNKQLASPEIERKVDALLKKMTLEEKLGQLVQYSDSGYSGQAQTADEAANPGKNPTAPHPVDAMELVSTGRLGSLLNTVWAGADEPVAARGGREEPAAYSADVRGGHHSWIQDDLSDAAGACGDIRSGTGEFACAYLGERGEDGRRGLVLFADGGYLERSAVGKNAGGRGRGSVSGSRDGAGLHTRISAR